MEPTLRKFGATLAGDHQGAALILELLRDKTDSRLRTATVTFQRGGTVLLQRTWIVRGRMTAAQLNL